MSKFIDLTGQKFGKLTVLKRTENKGRYPAWLCRCDCGIERVFIGNNLRNGYTVSCGCTRRGKREITHGVSMVRLRGIWRAVIGRCEHKQHPAYKYYGARGIKVCEDWKIEKTFIQWALSSGYDNSLTLDRIDNNKPYCPENCRWATMKEQGRNRRNNVFYDGKTIPEWAEISGIPANILYGRVLQYGWSIEKAISTPVRKRVVPLMFRSTQKDIS